jgi:hypothetical protein
MPYGDSNFAFILAYLVWCLVPCCG